MQTAPERHVEVEARRPARPSTPRRAPRPITENGCLRQECHGGSTRPPDLSSARSAVTQPASGRAGGRPAVENRETSLTRLASPRGRRDPPGRRVRAAPAQAGRNRARSTDSTSIRDHQLRCSSRNVCGNSRARRNGSQSWCAAVASTRELRGDQPPSRSKFSIRTTVRRQFRAMARP